MTLNPMVDHAKNWLLEYGKVRLQIMLEGMRYQRDPESIYVTPILETLMDGGSVNPVDILSLAWYVKFKGGL